MVIISVSYLGLMEVNYEHGKRLLNASMYSWPVISITLSINGWLLKDKLSIFLEFLLLVNFNLDGCVTDQIRLTIDLFDEYITEWFLIKYIH